MSKLDMNKLNLPGLHYSPVRDTAEILYGKSLISVFINSETNTLDVTADSLDDNGDFTCNTHWTTCSTEGEPIYDHDYQSAIKQVRHLLLWANRI